MRFLFVSLLVLGLAACSQITGNDEDRVDLLPGWERIEVRVPTALKLDTVMGRRAVVLDTALDTILTIAVRENLHRGWEVATFVIRDSIRSYRNNRLTSASTIAGTVIWERDSVPDSLSDDTYVVESECIYFETDVPAGHLWMPTAGDEYRVLVRRVLVSPEIRLPL